jgi:phosphoglycolate phosphatase-like HAD superfamily hydrolase
VVELDGPFPTGVGVSWMGALSEHYRRARELHPNDELCIVFDIDGTIVDPRHLIVRALLECDRHRGTELFRGLVAADISHHEDDVESLLTSLDVPAHERPAVAAHYREYLWDDEAVVAASRPFEGVLAVIRWFQLQPDTTIALNTGRSHTMRAATLASLNTMGEAFRVRFEPELLFTTEEGADVPRAKVAALDELARRGTRVVAVVDNEPENLRAMAEACGDDEVLFLHADTIFTSQRSPHDRVVAGRDYRLRDLVPPRSMLDRVTFVWHGVNDGVNLARYLASEIGWAEVDVRSDPFGRLVLRHDAFDVTPWTRDEPMLLATEAVPRLVAAGRSVKLDLKEDGPTLLRSIDLASSLDVDDDRLWFNAELPVLGETGFTVLRQRFPTATISCPVDFIVPLLSASRNATDRILEELAAWGISRLSVRWGPDARRVLDALEARGWEVNVYDVPYLEAFLWSSLLLPTSVTADFCFPEWGYAGRGSGADGAVHRSRP